MTAPPLVVHLRAADGATFDLQVPAPVVRHPVVRVAEVRAFAIATVQQWDGTKWVATT